MQDMTVNPKDKHGERSGKTIGILQPGYLPWLGFFEQVLVSDVFVIYDDVQYDKHGWRNRNRIKTANGIQWLSVPVLTSRNDSPRITDIKIDNRSNWRKKHLLSLTQSYSRAPYYKDYIPLFEDVYAREWHYLVDLDMHLILALSRLLGIDTDRIVRASTLDVSGNRIDRLIKLCKLFDATVFYEGAAGRSYIDDSTFLTHGITVKYQDYRHPMYSQLHGGFVPCLSVVDLLFNHGRDSLSILSSG